MRAGGGFAQPVQLLSPTPTPTPTPTPEPADREAVDNIILEELSKGMTREDSREEYLRVIDDLVDSGAGGLVLGCIEIELLIEQADRPALPMFDTTTLHAERAVDLSLGREIDAELPAE